MKLRGKAFAEIDRIAGAKGPGHNSVGGDKGSKLVEEGYKDSEACCCHTVSVSLEGSQGEAAAFERESMAEGPVLEKEKRVADFYSGEKQRRSKVARKGALSLTEVCSGKRSNMLDTIAGLTGAHGKKWVGAHISAAGGLPNAVRNALRIGGTCFALFLKMASAFLEACQRASYTPSEPGPHLGIPLSRRILPHGSYLINLANNDAEKRQRSYLNFLDDLKRCEACHIGLYNFHPGSTVGSCDIDQGIDHIANAINRAHGETSFVTIVLECMVSCPYFIHLALSSVGRRVKAMSLAKLLKSFVISFIVYMTRIVWAFVWIRATYLVLVMTFELLNHLKMS
jgi:hypothetical protein